jgi:hypothetical protein
VNLGIGIRFREIEHDSAPQNAADLDPLCSNLGRHVTAIDADISCVAVPPRGVV